MPFGKYKGALLANVPAKYLIFLYDNNKSGVITDYIKDSMDALKAEIKRGR